MAELAFGSVTTVAASATIAWALGRHPLGAVSRRRTPPGLHRLARPTAACAALSLLTSVAIPAEHINSAWKMAEAGLLLLLLAATTRWSPLRELRVAVPLAALAVALWPVPLVSGESFLESMGIATFWLLPALAAVAVGAYPRRQEHHRRLAVAEARRVQRLQLSRDLHDFVAHDISGIVVQAQAARFLAATDPAQAVPALERIEKAGLSALASMDRTILMLHGPETATTTALPGIDQLPALIAEFSSAGTTRAHLDMPAGATDGLSREAGAAAYRITAEALTNIRRHAPAATHATVTLTPTPTTVELHITNNNPTNPKNPANRTHAADSTPCPREGGGLGLPALTEHTEALGGTLMAGPYQDGWRLTAVLPTDLPTDSEARS